MIIVHSNAQLTYNHQTSVGFLIHQQSVERVRMYDRSAADRYGAKASTTRMSGMEHEHRNKA